MDGAGFDTTIVSSAGTSTLFDARADPIVTEIQAGTYVMMESDLDGLDLPFVPSLRSSRPSSASALAVVLNVGRKSIAGTRAAESDRRQDYGVRTAVPRRAHDVGVARSLPALDARILLRPKHVRLMQPARRAVAASRRRVVERCPSRHRAARSEQFVGLVGIDVGSSAAGRRLPRDGRPAGAIERARPSLHPAGAVGERRERGVVGRGPSRPATGRRPRPARGPARRPCRVRVRSRELPRAGRRYCARHVPADGRRAPAAPGRHRRHPADPRAVGAGLRPRSRPHGSDEPPAVVARDRPATMTGPLVPGLARADLARCRAPDRRPRAGWVPDLRPRVARLVARAPFARSARRACSRRDPGTDVGRVRAKAYRPGPPAACRFVVGSWDGSCAAVGSAAVEEGDALVAAGTWESVVAPVRARESARPRGCA